MARVIFKISGNSSTAIYTVPTGKVAKVILTEVSNFGNGSYIYVGDYSVKNGSGETVNTYNNSQSGGTTSIQAVPNDGYLVAGSTYDNMYIYTYIKKEHILVEDDVIKTSNGTNVINAIVIEEDV